ncbi:hypothetical protein BT63DRAFT_456425 [Microthyrium microscopicum]|uniref:Uncharacterized protein n=1 Tax=Microthyrium microscopicum TaxID=703497 RepID=A0A6A6UCY7_9PEZI|nr:hypothetical protein BT63DRAFT_456425 [Microthyrium microscopicum]
MSGHQNLSNLIFTSLSYTWINRCLAFHPPPSRPVSGHCLRIAMSSESLKIRHRSVAARSSFENEPALSLSFDSSPPSARHSLDSVPTPSSNHIRDDKAYLSLHSRHVYLPIGQKNFQTKVYRVFSESIFDPLRGTLTTIPVNPNNRTKAILCDQLVKPIPQFDGQSGDTTPSGESSSSSRSSIFKQRISHKPQTVKHHERVELRSPSNATFATPPVELEDPTPSAQASPAINAFPFPSTGELPSPLTPFSTRLSSSPLRPSQRHTPRSSSSRLSTPTRTPDRFIPLRPIRSARDSYEISRSPERLTDQEKIVRSVEVAPDPFSRRLRANAARLVSRIRGTPSHPINLGSRGSNSVVTLRRNSTGSAARTFSPGAI